MKNFIQRLILFFLPLIIIASPPVLILYYSQENFHNIDKVIENKSEYIIGYAYNEHNYKYLKYKSIIEHERNKIIALGSSRVLQFRQQMFEKPFYNAGFSVRGISDFLTFLKCIPSEKHPKYLIVGLDQWMFNSSWDNLKTRIDENQWKDNKSNNPKYGFRNIIKTYIDIFKGKIVPKTFYNVGNKFGLQAIINDQGFRNDGSFNYGNQITKLIANDSTAHDYKFLSTFSRIDQGTDRFQFGKNPNPKAIEELAKLLSYCRENEIYVIGFLPPFADKVYDKIHSSNDFAYIDSLAPELSPIFYKYGFEFYSFNSLSSCNSNDLEAIDGFHGGERTYLRILINILENNSKLDAVCNLKKLKVELYKIEDRFEVFGH